MIAVVQCPGSQDHAWEYVTSKKAAEVWIRERKAHIRKHQPQSGCIPSEILSDAAARKIRYRDGRRAYVF